MKKFYLLFTLATPLVTLAQDYVPLINEENTWMIQIVGWGTTNNTYFFQGDTIIDEMEYTKLMYEAQGLEGVFLYGMMREDVEEQKVYVRYTDTPEELFYDFGAEDGEEVTIYPMGFAMTATVESVGTEMVNGTERKRINFNFDWYTDSWIVGVGSTLGIVNPYSSFPDFSPRLTCFYEGNDLAWDYPDDDMTCDLQLAISENEPLGGLTIGPNPAIDHVHITFDELIHGRKVTVAIYSLTGDKLVERNFLSRQQISMDLPQMSDGVYIMRIMSGSAPVSTKRLIIKH